MRRSRARRRSRSVAGSWPIHQTSKSPGRRATTWRGSVHNELSERVVDHHTGRLVKTTGDGIIALFDSAERAVRTGAELVDALRAIQLRSRVGVHTGEVELAQGDVRGVAVHTAARIMAQAPSDEIWVSATVRELVDGTALEFEDRGEHELKGIPGARRLFSLVRSKVPRARSLADAR